MKQLKMPVFFIASFILFLFSIVIATSFGGVTIPLFETVQVFLAKLPFFYFETDSTFEQILLYIRLPRVIVASIVGASLAVCGVVMQSLFRNPMAEPGIIGISSGGSLGGVIAIYFGLSHISTFFVPVFGFLGALLTLLLVYIISTSNGKTSMLTLLLTGVAISSFISACSSLIITYASYGQLQQILYWLMGNLNGRDWDDVKLLILPFILCNILIFSYRKQLDILLLGEEEAKNLGIHVQRTRTILLISASLLTGVCVSLTGAIGFVGLIVPHMIRLLIGPTHRYLIPTSLIGGALFLTLADLIARLVIRPAEIQIGIITAFLGAPYFIFLILRQKKMEGLL
ncbi:iron ABC transporter permease [Ureibacillus sp. FSL K6-3587]|jgi:iron complex transport system permease protein|uniref:FecCD family ABC transporter permease n=1 Tax=Ureibacillus suwonensis TaxID=313007 RepID=A0ABW0R753_9BACL